MQIDDPIYILGAGAIGIPLAVQLSLARRNVILVRTSTERVQDEQVELTLIASDSQDGARATTSVTSLNQADVTHGIVVIAAKSYANAKIAAQLQAKGVDLPLVILQNGIGVERPYLDTGFSQVLRCVLYATGQREAHEPFLVRFRAITSSPIGVIRGRDEVLHHCVAQLSTPDLPFHDVENVHQDVWRKGIINAVFNTICPLLEVDNGVFAREPDVMALAHEVVDECANVAAAQGVAIDRTALAAQVLRLSRGSDGQLISTLQDLRRGNPTEIDSLNMEIARIGASMTPPVAVPKTELLGRLTLMKASVSLKSGLADPRQ